MKRICIVTATRAEYGLLTPLIKRVNDDSAFGLDLIATGTHLSRKYGYTVDEIRRDGFGITHEIPILADDNSPYGISITMANTLKGFAECFRDDRPDIIVILGDRTELLGVASAALNERIPIAHIHGGELTEGAIDECIRHAITKMSYLHFASTEEYRHRIIQMGEAPKRVFNVGALAVENILNTRLLDERDIRTDLSIPESEKYAIVTYHPVTMYNDTIEDQIRELCIAMDSRRDIFFVITGANADFGGERANDLLGEFARNHQNSIFFMNLGKKRYLSAMKYATFILGNSSSGVIEAPTMGTPTINVGERQKGRMMSGSVIGCKANYIEISAAIDKALKHKSEPSYLFGDGHTSERIYAEIKKYLNGMPSVIKEFKDFEFEV